MGSNSAKPLRVLVAEDELVNSTLLQGMLSKSSLSISEVICVGSLKATVEILDNDDDVDVVLLDLNLSDSVGLDTLIRVSKYPGVAVVVITGQYDDKLGLEAVAKGAQEYLIKGKYDILTLGKSILYAVQRKQGEDSVKRAYEELDNAHKEMKATQSQLVQNEKLASIGQLAAGVAHEINTPVGFVASNFQTLESYVGKIRKLLGMYDGLVKEIEDSGETDLLNKAGIVAEGRTDMKIDFILENIQSLFDDSIEGLARVTGIVQNLRDFSRIDQPGSRDEYDLNGGIEATLVVVKNEIKYDADVKTEFSQVPATCCNSGEINQVLLNILINAAQAIKSQEREDKGTITIRTYPTETEVVCEISDDGPGISADDLAKIFDPFFTTKPVGKGTGLGLSVSYDIIVHKHNGKLLAESGIGKETTFTVRLPITKKESSDRKEMGATSRAQLTACSYST